MPLCLLVMKILRFEMFPARARQPELMLCSLPMPLRMQMPMPETSPLMPNGVENRPYLDAEVAVVVGIEAVLVLHEVAQVRQTIL